MRPSRTLAFLAVTMALCACVPPPWRIADVRGFDQSRASPPELSTVEQHRKFYSMTVYPPGEDLGRRYKEISQVYGAVRREGAPAGVEAQRDEALHALKVSAAVLLADAVIEVRCGHIPPPGWYPESTAQACWGRAVLFQ